MPACWEESEEAMEPIHAAKVGDIITVRGKRYRLDKKTTTACAITRYYWWDELYDKYMRK